MESIEKSQYEIDGQYIKIALNIAQSFKKGFMSIHQDKDGEFFNIEVVEILLNGQTKQRKKEINLSFICV